MGINDLRHVAGSTLDAWDWTEDQLRLCVESEGDERATPPLNADLREALLTAIERAERIEAASGALLQALEDECQTCIDDEMDRLEEALDSGAKGAQ